jgi:hypothetical protein
VGMNDHKGSQTGSDLKEEALKAVEEFNKENITRQQKKTSKEQKKSKKEKKLIIGQWVLIIILVGIILYQTIALISVSGTDEKPLRKGIWNTDIQTDQCIRNLWKISRLIQDGKVSDNNQVCPASNKPYVIVRTDDNIIVRSPNPELYGFKDIRVSKKKPIPELIK